MRRSALFALVMTGAILTAPVAGAAETDRAAAYAEIGLGASLLDITNRTSKGSDKRTYRKTAPRIEGTLYRRINPTWDIGTGLIFDWVDEGPRNESLSRLGFRLFELKQHWTRGFATRYYFVVNRLYRVIPSYGYGLGVGLQAQIPGLPRYSLAADAEHSRLDMERREMVDSRTFTRLWIFSLTLKRRF